MSTEELYSLLCYEDYYWVFLFFLYIFIFLSLRGVKVIVETYKEAAPLRKVELIHSTILYHKKFSFWRDE